MNKNLLIHQRLNDTLDFKESLQIKDLERTDAHQNHSLNQTPPHDALICALGGCLIRRIPFNKRKRTVAMDAFTDNQVLLLFANSVQIGL
jgi:hypothetical protein